MPEEVHTHFDAGGNLTGTTVITRETEWDEQTRNRVLELDAYEALICQCGCGLPIAEAHREQPFLVDTVRCYAGRALEVKRRADEESAEKDKKPAGWNDGVHYFVRLPNNKDQEDVRGN